MQCQSMNHRSYLVLVSDLDAHFVAENEIPEDQLLVLLTKMQLQKVTTNAPCTKLLW